MDLQGSIPLKYIDDFKDNIKEGGIFAISGFDVVTSGTRYKLTDHKYMIRYTEETNIKKHDEGNNPIELEKFRFRNYKDFLELANKGEELPDVMGYLCGNIPRSMDRTEGAPRRLVLHLKTQE